MSALASPVSVAESFGEFRSNGLMVDGPTTGLEKIYDYEPGKHHPVHLGDVLGSRYKVIHKLGNGACGAIWLCRDVKAATPSYVAVKVLMAEASIQDCPEFRVNKLLEAGLDRGDLAERFGMPLDSFAVESPNGSHFCLVYPVLGPPVSKLFHVRKPEQILRNVCFQATQAMAALHSHGICHGDFRPSHILSRVSGMDGLSERLVREALGEPTTTPVLLPIGRGEGVPHTKPTAPQYLVEPIKWYDAEPRSSSSSGGGGGGGGGDHETPSSRFVIPSACVIDFAESFSVSNLPEDLGLPHHYCPPEYVFDKEIGYGTDLWALGCTLFELRTGRVLFESADAYDLDAYLVAVVELLGKLPEPWWSTTWEERTAYFEDATDRRGRPVRVRRRETARGARGGSARPPFSSLHDAVADGLVWGDGASPGHHHHHHHHNNRREIPRDEVDLFADLLKRLFRYLPEDRITAEEALSHPWFNMM